MSKAKGITCSLGFGVFLLIIGSIVLITRIHDVIVKSILRRELALRNGSMNYENWKSVDLEFKVYLFHVANADEVEHNGDVATVVEYGPYVYDEHLERIVIGVDDSADTLDYVARRTLIFNATKSGKCSEDDDITVLNIAYVGTILSVNQRFPAFLPTIGNNIPLLFPDPNSIFVRGKVRDILFDGLPLICDAAVHPELGMICHVLKSQLPPIVRVINSDDGVYAYSLFGNKNGSDDGPYTISRGIKDLYSVGEISKFKGSHYAEYWSVENCSVVKGTDSLFYHPLNSREPAVFTFASDLCRSVYVEYASDKVYNGLLGYHYKTMKNFWNGLDSSCYCPRAVDESMLCPIQGSIALDKCQQAPVIMTEPHFLHGSSDLFSNTKGLHPDEEKHSAFVVVEPVTGIPLSGSRKFQLNMMLQPLVVDIMRNVSHGLLPIVWAEEGLTPSVKLLAPVIQFHRIYRLLGFLSWIPFLLGVTMVMYSCWMNKAVKIGYATSRRVELQ